MRRSRAWASSVGTVVAVLAVATACLGSGEDAAAPAPTPEREFAGLLPETPAVDEPAPTSAPAAVAATPSSSPEALGTSLDCLSVRQRAAQMLLPLATQSELAGAHQLAGAGELGGVGLLGFADLGLAAELVALQEASFVPVLIASDEEGGEVQRLSNVLGSLPSAASSAATSTPDEVRLLFEDYGGLARDLGIDVIFGPVLDVGGGPGIESRSFSDDPAVVTEYGRAVADGLRAAGVMPVFKHFPGHGRATADSHLLLPTTPAIDELRSIDLVPYVELLADPSQHSSVAVMVGHLSVPGLSGDVPTSLSPETVDGLLRSELGFTGLVFTDALNMGAIVDAYSTLDALELSFRAGSDIAIIGSLADVGPALDHLVSVAAADADFATLIDNRATRVLAAKGESELCLGAQ